MTGKIELKWGALIGLANLAWLYLSYYLGFGDNGLAMIRMTVLVGFILSVAGYVFGLREVHRSVPESTFIESVRSGAIIGGIATVIAVLAQFGYLKWIDPGYTEYVAGETGKHFEKSGLSEEEVAQVVEGARKTYGFTNCLLQAGLGAFITGILSTFVIVAVRTRLRR